jgi:hypothetical protein
MKIGIMIDCLSPGVLESVLHFIFLHDKLMQNCQDFQEDFMELLRVKIVEHFFVFFSDHVYEEANMKKT